MKVLKPLQFCLTNRGDLGIATPQGTFAATAWGLGDEAFNSIGGNKFSWIAPDGNDYTESRDIFSRPTENEIISKMSPAIKAKALELQLIEE